MLSHTNAFTFVDWCVQTLGPWADDDRFSSHAPFHFDLSIFDLFVSCRNAATLVVIGEILAREPELLGEFLSTRRITVWYSAPSILALLTGTGGIVRVPRLLAWSSLPARSSRWLLAPAQANLARVTALEPVWSHRDQRLHGEPHSGRHPEHRTEPYPIGSVCPPLGTRRGRAAGKTCHPVRSVNS